AALRPARTAAAQHAPGAARGDEIGDTLPADLARNVRAVAARWGVTESTVYLAAYGLLVAKLGGDADVLIGIAYAGRDLPDTADMIGMFVNVLPIRVALGDADAFEQQVRGWRDACVAAFRHAHVSYERMVELAGGDRRDGPGELVKTMFDFEEPGPPPRALGDARLSVERRADRSAKFDLTLRCRPDALGRMRIALNFRRAALSVERARGLLDAYRCVL
ncbi:condensation domain-containing protein, partial [Burkholderia pseudomallei]